jgi:uncharacterized protein (TIGR03032 family)
LRTTLNIQDPLFISAPNGGGLFYAHRHLLMPLTNEDATGVTLSAEGIIWCVQSGGARSFREVRQGVLSSASAATGPLDLHDVLSTVDGIHAVFTETNQVVRLDDAFQVQESWSFGDEPDSAHVNCIVMHGGRLIASMFGAFTTHRGYKGQTRNAGRVIDVKSGEVLIEGLSQPHSLVTVGEQLWLCSSEDRVVRIYDRDFRLQRELALPGYTRGLAIGQDCVYVGLSRSRNLELAEIGEFTSAVVAILQRHSLDIVGYMPLPCNEIYDIRIAPSAEMVTDAMAATWVSERDASRDEIATLRGSLRDREETLQSTKSELDHMTRQEEYGRSELARISQLGEDNLARMMNDAAEERARLLQQAGDDLARMMEQVATTKEDGRIEVARVTQLGEDNLARMMNEAAEERARLLQQTSEEIARMMEQVAAVTEFGRAEVARVSQLGDDKLAQAMEQVAAVQSQLVAARGETVKRDARIHALEQVRGELDMIKSSRSWRWTRPMRFVTRLIQHRGLSAEDRRKLLRLPPTGSAPAASPLSESTPAVAPDVTRADAISAASHATPRTESVELTLAEPTGNRRDFFVWAVIDWHFRIQRPQHLARELAAAGHRVFYVSNNFIDRREPGFSVESLDSEGRLFQIHLHLQGSPAIYHGSPDSGALLQLRDSIGLLLAWTRSRACVSLVQHPYWLETAQVLPNQRLVYDCMDHHGGFADNCDDVLAREHELMRDADLLVVTSEWLDVEAGKYNPRRMMIRNACQYEHFSQPPGKIFHDPRGRRIIGYYGAIAEWFDVELLEKLARRFDDCLVLLVGADTSGAQRRLQSLGNVEFTGEVPYASLPYYLGAFDVCLLPFQVIPLTLATNPVKVYEYLSAGKEVVSVDLPEIRQFGDLVHTGADHPGFLDAVAQALEAHPGADVVARRREFAAEQTWAHRVHDLVEGIEALPEPRVSVVVVTYNNLDLTKACLHSLERYSDYGNLEVIVVDNASADDTPEFLRSWASQGKDRKLILNEDNRGFAAANNQGLAIADGDYLVMLNNDTYVTPGWIATLVAHLRRSEKLGMLGPVTNNIGNEARIEIRYDTMDEMLPAAAAYTAHHAGRLTPLRTAAFFCVMMPRKVYEKVGPLDEAFGIGFFEDDDYCRRVDQAGWTIACADDVFVHHNLSASFNKLKQETRQALFEQNKVTYEAKWGTWTPHKYRGA